MKGALSAQLRSEAQRSAKMGKMRKLAQNAQAGVNSASQRKLAQNAQAGAKLVRKMRTLAHFCRAPKTVKML
jgi:hypothetical protein